MEAVEGSKVGDLGGVRVGGVGEVGVVGSVIDGRTDLHGRRVGFKSTQARGHGTGRGDEWE
jgi:hypothetical protein